MSRQGELKREFKAAGCFKKREDTRHERWHSPITGEDFEMGRHDNEEVHKGMEMKLRKLAGVPKQR